MKLDKSCEFAYITGKQITPEQAIDVILRTDENITCFDKRLWGNNWELFNARIDAHLESHQLDEKVKCLRSHLKVVELQCLKNSLISVPFSHHHSSWVRETGEIGFFDDLRSTPSAEEIYDDCLKIAKAFPYIEMVVTVFAKDEPYEMNAEDKYAIATFIIADGNVLIDFNQHMKYHKAKPLPKLPQNRDFEECYLSSSALAVIYERIKYALRVMHMNFEPPKEDTIFRAPYIIIHPSLVTPEQALEILAYTDPKLSHDFTPCVVTPHKFMQFCSLWGIEKLDVGMREELRMNILKLIYFRYIKTQKLSIFSNYSGIADMPWLFENGHIFKVAQLLRDTSIGHIMEELRELAQLFPQLSMNVSVIDSGGVECDITDKKFVSKISDASNLPNIASFTVDNGKVIRHPQSKGTIIAQFSNIGYIVSMCAYSKNGAIHPSCRHPMRTAFTFKHKYSKEFVDKFIQRTIEQSMEVQNDHAKSEGVS